MGRLGFMSGFLGSYTHVEGIGCGCCLGQEISQPNDPKQLAKREKKKSVKNSKWFTKLFGYFRLDVPSKSQDPIAGSLTQSSSSIDENAQNQTHLQKKFMKDSAHHNALMDTKKKSKDAKNPFLVHLGKTHKRDAYSNTKKKIIATQVLNLRQKQSKDCKKRFVSLNTQNEEAIEADERLKNAIIKPRKVYSDFKNGFQYA